MKIYTKNGDSGETSLGNGKRISKSDLRVEVYGTIDELIAFIGSIRDYITDDVISGQIVKIQSDLMICAAILASDTDSDKLPKLSSESVVWLEKEIDKMESTLMNAKGFILPGGHPAVSFCNISRTVCRRAERVIITLSEKTPIPHVIIQYINRLSDYLFVLSRELSRIFKIEEIHWRPNLE